MHEGAIASQILAAASKWVSDPVSVPTIVSVSIGEFRNIDPESLSFAYDALKPEFGGMSLSTLVIELVAAKAKCTGAGHVYHPTADHLFQCPTCGNGIGTMVTGIELELKAIKRKEQADA